MVKRIGTFGTKTRHKLKKSQKEKSKLSLTKFFKSYNNDEKVILKADSYYKRGMYFMRFHGKVGKIVGMRGSCYEVQIKDFNKPKKLIVHPIHLKKVE
jgi:large subunit ribosomal protein L21e